MAFFQKHSYDVNNGTQQYHKNVTHCTTRIKQSVSNLNRPTDSKLAQKIHNRPKIFEIVLKFSNCTKFVSLDEAIKNYDYNKKKNRKKYKNLDNDDFLRIYK